jgi:glycosyltransferase involved in cell wall biosynthesis
MVSVITITYNRAHLVSGTIKSVLLQSYSDFEYLIIDDGSTDDTEKIVRSFNDQRIIYKKVQHTGKIAWLRNRAMQSVKGEFIAFVDSDDLWMEEKLKKQVECLSDRQADFSFCDAELFSSDKIILSSLYDKHDIESAAEFFLMLIADVRFVIFPSSILFKKSVLSKTGYLHEDYTSGDKEFLCRLALHSKGCFVNRKLVRIRRHDENVTNDFDHVKGIFEEELKTIQNFYDQNEIDKKLYKRLKIQFRYKLAEHFYRSGGFAEAKANYLKVLLLQPLNLRAFIRLFISEFKNRRVN